MADIKDIVETLQSLPLELRYQTVDDIVRRESQSALASKQLKLKRHFETHTEQGKRTDLISKRTCTSNEVQVRRSRRLSATEKVAGLFQEGGQTVRARIYVLEKAREEPERYDRFREQMNREDSPYKAYAALKAFERADKFEQECIPERGQSFVKRGDKWILGDHRLMCGDATRGNDVAHLLEGAIPILMVTDPPYGVNYDPSWRKKIGNRNPNRMGRIPNDDRVDWSEAWAHFYGDVAYVWYADRHAATVQTSLHKNDLIVRNQLVWVKPRPVLSRGHYSSQKETCFYAVRGGKAAHWNTARSRPDVWMFDDPKDRGQGHSTQKPINYTLWPIEDNSAPGDGVYDPFVGSGTTIIAAEESGRRCYAMEIDPGYCAVAIERWQSATGQQAYLASTGQTYADVMCERQQFNDVADEATRVGQ